VWLNEKTLTTTTEFTTANAVATFLESSTGTLLGPNMAPRILGYSYSSLGVAHTVNLYLAVSTTSPVNEQIAIDAPTTTVNSINMTCGPRDGIVVPRRYGRTNNGTTGQALDASLGALNNTAPMVLMFTTTGKADTGTFRVWYDYVSMGGTL